MVLLTKVPYDFMRFYLLACISKDIVHDVKCRVAIILVNKLWLDDLPVKLPSHWIAFEGIGKYNASLQWSVFLLSGIYLKSFSSSVSPQR